MIVLTALVMLALVNAPASQAHTSLAEHGNSTADYYVATDGNDNWSGTLATPNSGATDGPFATLERARDVIRAETANGMTSDIKVFVRGGTYTLSSTLTFTPADSGKDGHMITYAAYPGEFPKFVGGSAVTGWVPYSGNIYRAQVGVGVTLRSLFENDQRSVPARTPNSGYSFVDAANPTSPNTSFYFKSGDIPDGTSTQALQMVIWPGSASGLTQYGSNLLNVTAVDYTDHKVTVGAGALYAIGQDSHYYVQGPLSLLDAPGEFSMDSSTGYLYYWPRSLPISSQQIVRPALTRLFDIAGTCTGTSCDASNLVENLSFNGLTFAYSDVPATVPFSGAYEQAVRLTAVQNVTISDTLIEHVGAQGIDAGGWVQNVTISGNALSDIGGACINMHGPAPVIGGSAPNYVNKNNDITNTLFSGCGTVVGAGNGIHLSQSGANTITHNQFSNIARTGVAFFGPVWPTTYIGKLVNGINVTAGNWQQISYARDTTIEANRFDQVMTESHDGGVLHTAATGPNNSIKGNVIGHTDRKQDWSGGLVLAGIYLDAWSDDVKVDHNLIADFPTSGGAAGNWHPIFQNGVNVEIVNNIVADNPEASAAFVSYASGFGQTTTAKLTHNVFANSGAAPVQWSVYTPWAANQIGVADNNVVSTGTTATVAGPGLSWLGWSGDFAEWQQMRHATYDRRSVTVDPQFVDPAAGDYRLQPSSPARELGVTDIDVAHAGLTANFKIPSGTDDPLQSLHAVTPESSAVLNIQGARPERLGILARSASGRLLALTRKDLTFASANSAIAFASRTGLVFGHRTGHTQITITADVDGTEKSTSVWVYVDDPIEELKVTVPGTDTSQTIAAGKTAQLQVVGETAAGVYRNVDAADLSYTSSDPTVASVSASGAVSGLAPGSATITATLNEGGQSSVGSVQVAVRGDYLDMVTMTLEHTTLQPGATSTSTLSGLLSNGSSAALSGAQVTYATADPAVATISATGTVTAVAEGRTKVRTDVTLDGVTRSAEATIVVFPTGGDDVPSPWQVDRYGGAVGYVTGDGSSFKFVGTGNVLPAGQPDHRQLLSRLETLGPETSISVTATVNSVVPLGQNAGIGLTLQAPTSTTGAPAFVSVIVTAGGTAYLDVRAADGGAEATYGRLDTDGATAIKLTREGNRYTAYLETNGQWVEVAHADTTALGTTVLAGITTRMADTKLPLEAELSDVVIDVN